MKTSPISARAIYKAIPEKSEGAQKTANNAAKEKSEKHNKPKDIKRDLRNKTAQ